MKVLAIIPYVGELVIEDCIKAIENQTKKVDDIVIVENVYPAMRAFNICMDYGYRNGFDYIWKVDADIIMYENALEKYLSLMCNNIFAITINAIDFINGPDSPGGTFLFDMNLLKDKYKFEETAFADVNFIKDISNRTGWVYKHDGTNIAIHHPIYTPFELYRKIRYSVPKYINNSIFLWSYVKFLFQDGLIKYPDNKTLRIGADIFGKIISMPQCYQAIDNNSNNLKIEWDKMLKSGLRDYELDGTEFYAMKGWDERAQNIITNGVKIPDYVKRINSNFT